MDPLEDVPSILNAPYVVRIKILSQLTLQEQLILRQVCKTTKEWIDISSLVHHIPVTVIEDHGEKTFERFLEKRPPHLITNMHIKNEKSDIFMDPSLPYFLHLYSSSISSLRMKRFFTCKTREECMFYESFSNLMELEIDKISIPIDGEVMTSFPSSFKSLKKLELGDVKAFPEPPDDQFGAALIPLDFQRPMGLYVWNLIGFCENIESLVYPNTAKYFFQAFVDGRGRGEFGMFCDYVLSRSLQLTKKVSNLSTCDFRNDTWPPDSKNALTLLKMGKEFGIKYLNVNANLFQFISISALTRMYDLPSTTGDCIHSFKNFNCLINEKLPSVKKISLVASKVSTRLDYSCSFNGPHIFPNLEEIEINVDVGFAHCTQDVFRRAREFRGVHNLLSHFFYDTEMILVEEEKEVRVYDSVTSLTVTFNDLPTAIMQKGKATPQDLPLKWIVKGLPNLRKLRLVGWNSGPEIYDMLWKSFPCLEELVIEDCESMIESCFRVALECGSAFQNLKELRKITLKGNPKMTDVSDDTIRKLFEDRMNLIPSQFLSRYPNVMTWTRCSPDPI